MDSSKKRKGNSEEMTSGSFSTIEMSAEDLRSQLESSEPLPYIKDYFLNNENEDNVTNYIKAGGSVAEICGVLTKIDLKRKEQSAIIFNALHLVVIKSITEFSDQNQFRDDCKQFISNYIGELQIVLSTNTILKNKKIVLKLLASISVVSTSLASQILTMLSLSKEDLDLLSTHSDPLDDQSLRVSFIHFLLSFVIDQTPKVIEKLLLKKSWLPSIFPGLRHDLPFTVHLVLSALEEKIVNNVNISKTAKLLVFNAHSLIHLSELYTWNPKAWYDANPHKTYSGDFSENEMSGIRLNVHKLLLKICTSSKLGIVFQDTLYGTTNVQKNYTLCNFLQKFKEPWEDNLKKELLHKTLITCPDVIKSVLNTIVPLLKSFSPKWLEVLQFISEVLNSINLNLVDQTPQTYTNIIQDIVVPKQILDLIKSGKHLNSENQLVKLSCVQFISKALNNYWNIYTEINKDTHGLSTFQSNMAAYFINNLPNTVEMLECLKSAYINKDEGSVKEVINLFVLYEKVCPELVDIIRYDDTITQWIEEETSKSVQEEDYTLIMNLIRLEIIINPLDPYQNEFLNRLKWTTASVNNKAIGLEIIKEFLDRSGIFISSPKELNLWIYCIETNLNPDVGSLMALSLKWALENTNVIYKNILKAQEHSTAEEASDLNLDDFLKLSVNDDVSGLEETNISSVLHLSPLLPSILHVLSEKQNFEPSCNFLVAFVVYTLHQQAEVKPFVALLKKYNNPAIEKVLLYIESWLNHPKILDFVPFSNSIFSVSTKFILKEKSMNFSEITDMPLQKVEAELLFEQCIFMACELSRLNKATDLRLERIVQVVTHCLSQKDLQVNLNHPTLLSNFHPLRNVGYSNLTDLIMVVSEEANLCEQTLAPFSHRLAFELKYAKKVVHNCEEKPKLLKLFKIFHFSRSDTEDLITYVFSMKSKYFMHQNELSPWILVAEHLLSLAKEHKIAVSEDNFISLLNTLIALSKKGFDLSDLCSTLLSYLKSVCSEINGFLMDSFKEFFHTLCSSSLWHEELCVYLLHYFEEIDYNQIPVERAITLLASLDNYNSTHYKVVADSAGIIYQGLCETPSPKWLSHLKNISSVLSVETCKKVCKRVKKHAKEICISISALSAIEMVFTKADELYSLYSLTITWLNEALNSSVNSIEQAEREEMCGILQRILSSNIDRTVTEKANQNLLMNLLLHGLKLPSPPMLDVTQSFVKYSVIKLPPGEIFELLCSHSCFLDVLLDESSAKYSTLNLMLELLSLDNSLISANHVPVLLSSYNATLSKTDQKILKILQMYEKVGCINLACWKPYVWGEVAVDHYSVRSKISPVKSNPVVTLELIDKNFVQRTITKYPLNRGLDNDYELDDNEIYDPAFYLPLLSQLVGETAGAWKVGGSGAIGLTIAALASSEPSIRAAAYHVLHRFYLSLKDHKDNLIWKHFIEAIRGGIVGLGEGDNARLSSIVTTFLARASIIMSSPDDPLYFTLHNFIYAKPQLKLNTVPAFLEMFHSHRNQKLHQRWLLEVLRDGFREQRDLQLALNCLIFKFILDFYSCSLASSKTKELIEGLVTKCILFVDEKQLLINKYSIVPWIISANLNILDKLPKKISPQYLSLINLFNKQ